MKPGPDVSTIYRIARYYYADGFSQDQIAGKEGVSRSQISRLIDKARELGLVRITLVPPSSLRAEELARDLAKALGLKSAIVVPVRKNANDEEISLAIATRAADCLPAILADYEFVGLGWGYTVYKTAELLPRGLGTGARPYFVPLIGTSGDDNPNLQINTIIDRFGAAFRTKGLFVNIPCVRETDAPLSRIEAQRVAMLQERWGQLDVAVVGLGAPPTESPGLIDELPAECKAELKRSSACGDILAHFFGADGEILNVEHSYKLLAFDIAGLRRLKRSICLAGGAAKVGGIVTAARAGFISDLITDESTAIEALERARRRHGAQAPVRDAEVPESGAKAL
ncbi:MAG: sugar-binding domain-containing protein [Spirochaetales bacterium]|jgi:DNA-binding transcriptional regulator LsrR (DeoR family)|uniref:Transcriptional regulator, DeoR family n=1 Tax=uncultured Spirochaetota bacterium TaxID=460511 RepID=A0A652ZZA3_9SPIR|nr:sugar-binding domain-containing protein [Spirochaetales bacterium]NLX45165.1 DNA-binding transcriptional regulator [Treponema sp.]VBB41083.1 Transcriptional regulator, DeoR family [uncultured Spirochaetota bacterium]HOI22141.1 sugar-binding domain-containing protein [Spirochaetales bacterium]